MNSTLFWQTTMPRASTHEKFRRILKFYYKVVYGNNELYPEAVSWFSVNVGKEKLRNDIQDHFENAIEDIHAKLDVC